MPEDVSQPGFEIGVLGDLRVANEGDPLDIGGPQQRLILALLVSAAPDPVSIDSLMFSVWGDSPPPTAISPPADTCTR